MRNQGGAGPRARLVNARREMADVNPVTREGEGKVVIG